MKDTECRDLLEVLDDRYGRSSTVITTQLATKAWHDALREPLVADGICDRLVQPTRPIVEGRIRKEEERDDYRHHQDYGGPPAVITRVAALRPRQLRPALRAVRAGQERRFAPTCPGVPGTLSESPEPVSEAAGLRGVICPSRTRCSFATGRTFRTRRSRSRTTSSGARLVSRRRRAWLPWGERSP